MEIKISLLCSNCEKELLSGKVKETDNGLIAYVVPCKNCAAQQGVQSDGLESKQIIDPDVVQAMQDDPNDI